MNIFFPSLLVFAMLNAGSAIAQDTQSQHGGIPPTTTFQQKEAPGLPAPSSPSAPSASPVRQPGIYHYYDKTSESWVSGMYSPIENSYGPETIVVPGYYPPWPPSPPPFPGGAPSRDWSPQRPPAWTSGSPLPPAGLYPPKTDISPSWDRAPGGAGGYFPPPTPSRQ